MSIGKVEFGHAGFGDRQAKAFSAHGANHTAENVGWNTQEGDAAAVEAVDKWMKSKEHKAHMLGSVLPAGVHNPAEGTEILLTNGAPARNGGPAEASGGRTPGLRGLET
jgi:uncharacterized protein YkwD